MSSKGGGFEREFCRTLTVWWTGDPERDVIFWRTSQSGGRATTRRKAGKRTTQAHCGDITAVEPEGKPLTDLITWELKRGYNKAALHDVVDKPKKDVLQEWEKWVRQAKAAAANAGSPYWAIVHRRDHRKPLVCVPVRLMDELELFGGVDLTVCPLLEIVLGLDGDFEHLALFALSYWFENVTPAAILAVAKGQEVPECYLTKPEG